MKTDIYNAAVHLLRASKLLLKHDLKVSNDLLDLSEKYLLELENECLSKSDKETINEYEINLLMGD